MKKIILALIAVSAGLFFASCDDIFKPDDGASVSYTVTFDPQGGTINGTANPMAITVDAGGTIANLPVPAREDYTFGGWFTAAGGAGNPFTSTTPVNRDITLYAKWTGNGGEIDQGTYTVTFDPQGGTVNPAAITVGAGGTIADLPVPALVNYTFGGWFTVAGGAGNGFTPVTPVNSDITVYAKWTGNGDGEVDQGTYTVTFDARGGTVSETTRTVDAGAAIGSLPDPHRSGGYVFDGWFTAPEGGDQFFAGTIVPGSLTLYARWSGGGSQSVKYAETYWGEWVRIDTGDTWYISGNMIKVNGNESSINPTLTRQSAQVTRVTGSGDPYFLIASRTANATLRGKVILMDNSSSGSASVARSLGSIPPYIAVSDPAQPEKQPVTVQPDPVTGEFDTSGWIPGNSLEVTIEDYGTPIPVPPLPVPPPDDTYIPPVVPIPVVTEGVNLKVSLRLQDSAEDSTRLYADMTSLDFVLEVENIGTEDCTAATYAIEHDSAYLTVYDPAPNRRLGTLTPKKEGGTTYKKSIPLTITSRPLPGDSALQDVEIGVKINDTIAGKTWNDSVSIRYNRAEIPFHIYSERPVQGIVKVPGGKTHHFRTSEASYGECSYTMYLPWSKADYFVIFSGATAATESAYSLGINTTPSRAFSVFEDTGIYEPNNDEDHAVLIESSDSIMAYLHGGSNADIDYYRINLGNEVPVIKTVSIAEPLADNCVLRPDQWIGSQDDYVNPGETFYYDITVRNSAESAVSGLQAGLSTKASGVSVDTSSAYLGTLSPGASGTATFRFTVASNYSAGTEIPFIFTLTAGDKTWQDAPPAVMVKIPTPGGLQAAGASANSVGLNWNAVSGAAGYRVYYAASETGTYSQAGSTGAGVNAYTHQGLGPGTTYYYKVTALDSYGGESGLSGAVPARTWVNLVFNRSVSGTGASSGVPHYYRFYVSEGVNYIFTSDKAGAVTWEGGSSWFSLGSGTQTRAPSQSGWALAGFASAGDYTLTVKTNEAAVTGFSFGTVPVSEGTISEADKTIAVIVPYGTNLASLTPALTAAAGWTCATTGARNFSGPVEYRFTKGGADQAYTVTVTRRGQGAITIDPPGGDISIAGFPAASFTVSRSGGADTYTIQISGADYSGYEWYVDDIAKTADSGSEGRAFTVRAAAYPLGKHTLTLIVYKNGVPYSNERSFTVTG
jgi:uncharacterized repeat protein (TIGR02543 family)